MATDTKIPVTLPTILIVEDNVFMANMIERKFPKGKFNVVKVFDAEVAQDKLANRKNMWSKHPDPFRKHTTIVDEKPDGSIHLK